MEDQFKEKDIYSTPNMFTRLFDDIIGKKFNIIYNENDLAKRDEMMKEMVEFFETHGGKNTKQFINRLKVSYESADFSNGTTCLLNPMYIINNNNIYKIYNNEIRIRRAVDNLYAAIYNTGFEIPASYVSELVNMTLAHFGFFKDDDDEKINKYNPGVLFTIYLGLFARKTTKYAYTSLWYIIMVIKNLSIYSTMPKEVYESNPKYKENIKNLFKIIILLESKCSKDQEKREENKKEKGAQKESLKKLSEELKEDLK